MLEFEIVELTTFVFGAMYEFWISEPGPISHPDSIFVVPVMQEKGWIVAFLPISAFSSIYTDSGCLMMTPFLIQKLTKFFKIKKRQKTLNTNHLDCRDSKTYHLHLHQNNQQ